MADWLKDCEICNAGLCKTVDSLKEEGLSINAACVKMADETDGLYTKEAIRGRYGWHTAKVKKVVENQQRRKRQQMNRRPNEESFCTEDFEAAYEKFYAQVQLSKLEDWANTSRKYAQDHINYIDDLINI